jgi:hypothetical protein
VLWGQHKACFSHPLRASPLVLCLERLHCGNHQISLLREFQLSGRQHVNMCAGPPHDTPHAAEDGKL